MSPAETRLRGERPLAGDMALMVFGIQCMALALRTSSWSFDVSQVGKEWLISTNRVHGSGQQQYIGTRDPSLLTYSSSIITTSNNHYYFTHHHQSLNHSINFPTKQPSNHQHEVHSRRRCLHGCHHHGQPHLQQALGPALGSQQGRG